MFDRVLNIPPNKRRSKNPIVSCLCTLQKDLEVKFSNLLKHQKLKHQIILPSVSLHESPGFNGFP